MKVALSHSTIPNDMVISINNFLGHSVHVIYSKSQICGIHEFIDPSVCSYNRYWPAVHLSLVRQDKISSGKALACFYSRVKTSQVLGNGKVSFFWALELHLCPASRKNLASET